jgi:hypothetical protein
VNKRIIIAILFCCGLMASSCTVVPKPTYIINSLPSFDASTPVDQPTNQNSGFIGFLQNGNGIITQNAVDRYNNLIERYDEMLLKDTGYKIQKNSGILPIEGNNKLFEMDKQHLFYFIIMNQWNKQNRSNQ